MSLPLHRSIEAHWREHRPRMVQALEQSGQLEMAIERAADQTAAATSAAMRNGMSAPEAFELFRDEWAFLPSEADVPTLPPGRNPLTLEKPVDSEDP
jgi:hypothetical protein